MDKYEMIINADSRMMEYIMEEKVVLQDDMDGQGVWIVKWDIDTPLPEGIKVGKQDGA